MQANGSVLRVSSLVYQNDFYSLSFALDQSTHSSVDVTFMRLLLCHVSLHGSFYFHSL